MNTCEKCNSPVPEEKAFCPNCGAAMTPEREHAPDGSEEMIETMYGFDADKNPPASQPSPTPVKVPLSSASPASASARQQPSVMSYGLSDVAPQAASADGNSRTLQSVLIAAAALFVLSIAVVAILYVMGKI